ncbi:MAG: IucA/IucC family protein, partial [Desulfobacterales bacterium]
MLTSLIYLDRYRNEGTRTYSIHADYTEARETYRPNSEHTQFDLPVFEVPRNQMKIYTANPSDELATRYLAEDKILFCIHPQILEERQDDPYIKHIQSIGVAHKHIAVAPSSSTRTLYVLDKQIPHAIKVHFPFRISRYGRKMREEVLEQAINLSMELEKRICHLDNRFAFLREVIAVVLRNLQPDSIRGENWGYLIRDMKPFPTADHKRFLI